MLFTIISGISLQISTFLYIITTFCIYIYIYSWNIFEDMDTKHQNNKKNSYIYIYMI